MSFQTIPKKEKKQGCFFFPPKKELIHFMNIHAAQQNQSPDWVSSGNNNLVIHQKLICKITGKEIWFTFLSDLLLFKENKIVLGKITHPEN